MNDKCCGKEMSDLEERVKKLEEEVFGEKPVDCIMGCSMKGFVDEPKPSLRAEIKLIQFWISDLNRRMNEIDK